MERMRRFSEPLGPNGPARSCGPTPRNVSTPGPTPRNYMTRLQTARSEDLNTQCFDLRSTGSTSDSTFSDCSGSEPNNYYREVVGLSVSEESVDYPQEFSLVRTHPEVRTSAEEDAWLKDHIKMIHTRRLRVPGRSSHCGSISDEPLCSPCPSSLFRQTSDLRQSQSDGPSLVQEPQLTVQLYRWPGFLRTYGAKRKDDLFVRVPLEMMLDNPVLYLELSREFFPSEVDSDEEESPGAFNPFEGQTTIRVPLSKRMPGRESWNVKLNPNGPNRRIKMECSKCTILIYARAQRSREALLHFNLIMEALTLWKAIQWDLSTIPIIHHMSENLDDALRPEFYMLVIRVLHENVTKVRKLIQEPISRGSTCDGLQSHLIPTFHDLHQNSPEIVLSRIADPVHPLGPVFSVLDWLWAECHMDMPAPDLSKARLTLFKSDFRRKTEFKVEGWLKRQFQALSMIVASLMMTAVDQIFLSPCNVGRVLGSISQERVLGSISQENKIEDQIP